MGGGASYPPAPAAAATADGPVYPPPPDAGAAMADGPSPDSDPGDAGSSGIRTVPDAAPSTSPAVTCPGSDGTLRLCLRFEDGVVDESGAVREVTSDEVSLEPGAPGAGQAARLTADSSLRVPNSDGLDLTTFTIEAWIRLESLPSGGGRAGIVDKDARYGAFVLPNGAMACSARGSLATSPPGLVPVGRWVAVACTADDTSVRTWISGRMRAEAMAGPPAGMPSNGLAIGSNMPSGDPLIGHLDNVRIWSRVLPEAQICASAVGCN
jgi:hypothetical protein